jgi:hypothetical protein
MIFGSKDTLENLGGVGAFFDALPSQILVASPSDIITDIRLSEMVKRKQPSLREKEAIKNRLVHLAHQLCADQGQLIGEALSQIPIDDRSRKFFSDICSATPCAYTNTNLGEKVIFACVPGKSWRADIYFGRENGLGTIQNTKLFTSSDAAEFWKASLTAHELWQASAFNFEDSMDGSVTKTIDGVAGLAANEI